MKRPKWRVARAGAWFGALGLASGFGVAQEMVLPDHEVPSPDVASEALRSDQPRTGFVKLGPFDILPKFESSIYYDDNVGADPTDEDDGLVLTLAPTIGAVAMDMEQGMGKRMNLSYMPEFIFFFNEDGDRDRVNHTALVAGALGGAKLSVSFDQRFRFTTGPVIDLGGQADRMSYNTRLRSSYTMSDKTSLEINGALRVVDYKEDIYTSSYDISNDDWIRYRYSAKLDLGLGLVFGYTGIEDRPDQTYEQLLAEARYAIAEKVDLTASAGAELRQYKSGIDDNLNPIWNVAAAYRPRDSTVLTLALFQQYRSSGRAGDQSYVYTGASLRVRQMLMQRWALNLSGSYSHADYEGTESGTQADRTDDLVLLRASVDFYIRPRWTAGVFYDYQTRSSNIDDLEFDRNRVGVQTAWSY